MSISDTLHDAIRHSPDDDLLRLACADALEEEGDLDRAAFIRLQLRVAQHTLRPDERKPALAQLRQLLDRNLDSWLEAWRWTFPSRIRTPGNPPTLYVDLSDPLQGCTLGETWLSPPGFARNGISRLRFRRGFLEQITLHPTALLTAGYRRTTVRGPRPTLRIDWDAPHHWFSRDVVSNAEKWDQSRLIEHVEGVSFSGLGTCGILDFRRIPRTASRLTGLSLSGSAITDAVASAMLGAKCPLRSLSFQETDTGVATLRELVDQGHAERLESLSLMSQRLHAAQEVGEALRRAGSWPRLRWLGCNLSPDRLEWLEVPGLFPQLRTLDLYETGLSEEVAARLLTSPHLPNLEGLGVRKRRCGLTREEEERLRQRFGARFCAYSF
jgi:uncharacterized protein (TIGR02996 family)